MENWSQYSLLDPSEKEVQCATGMSLECGETVCLLFVRNFNVFSGFVGSLN